LQTTTNGMLRIRVCLIFALLILCAAGPASGYAVITHEAIIDTAWKNITPLLLQRFPDATPDDLAKAHAFAYGGCIIQDMGYYPLGSKNFSNLAHYVRSGDFVEALLGDAQDLDEYAFALGALSHYAADNNGHPIAVNRAVAIEYPKLHSQYGNEVTYADNPAAHLKTEFGFDVSQVAQGNYAAQDYHNFIGFQVSKDLLERAFHDTYGLELKKQFVSIDLALGTYRRTVATCWRCSSRHDHMWRSYRLAAVLDPSRACRERTCAGQTAFGWIIQLCPGITIAFHL
jgi:Zinc dependent phospholipase C